MTDHENTHPDTPTSEFKRNTTESRSFDDTNPELAAKLRAVIKDPEYIRFANGEGEGDPVLAFEQLPDDVRERLAPLRDRIGWPDAESSTKLACTYDLSEYNEKAIGHLIYAGDRLPLELREVGLNNFIAFLGVPPVRLGPEGRFVSGYSDGEAPSAHEQPYATAPYAIRFREVAPKLSDALAEAFAPPASDYERWQDYSPDRRIRKFTDNPALAEAVKMAYQLMGRLVRPDDRIIGERVRAEVFGGEAADVSLITDVHEALTT